MMETTKPEKIRTCTTCGITNVDASFEMQRNQCRPCRRKASAAYSKMRKESPDYNKLRTCLTCQASSADREFQLGRNRCRECYLKYSLMMTRKSQAKDREGYLKKHREWNRKDRLKQPEKWLAYRRTRQFKEKYGITLDQFYEMLRNQDNRCTICKKHKDNCPRKTLHVDHCHKSGKVRQLLCLHCNNMIGFADDNIDTMRRGIAYLETHNQ